jgi:hypothetical protein
VASIGGSLVVGTCCCGRLGSLALDTATMNFARHRHDCEDIWSRGSFVLEASGGAILVRLVLVVCGPSGRNGDRLMIAARVIVVVHLVSWTVVAPGRDCWH